MKTRPTTVIHEYTNASNVSVADLIELLKENFRHTDIIVRMRLDEHFEIEVTESNDMRSVQESR